MDAIFSSKLYKAHRNKERIHAALTNPINTELVQQLREYLDEDPAKTVDVTDVDVTDVDVEDVDVAEGPDAAKTKEPESTETSSGAPKPRPGKTAEKIDKALDHENKLDKALEEDLGDPAVADEETDDDFPNPESAESATQLPKNTVTAALQPSDSIIGLLNSKNDTAGVLRVVRKGDEFWIYYQDKYNLNSIMAPAISLLEGAGYPLAFNRLARTDNAIVFDVTEVNEAGDRDEK